MIMLSLTLLLKTGNIIRVLALTMMLITRIKWVKSKDILIIKELESSIANDEFKIIRQ